MTSQLSAFTGAVILTMTLGGCASLRDRPADDAQPQALTAAQVKKMIDEALARDHARRKAEDSENAAQDIDGIDGVVARLDAANLNHPVIAMKREIRGCAIQMVVYADTDVATATDACLRIYNRSPSGGRVNGTPVLMKTQ
jgi:hypothetical protein